MVPYRTTKATLVAVGPLDNQTSILNTIAELEVVEDDLAIGTLGAAVGALLEDVGTTKQRLALFLHKDAALLGRDGSHNGRRRGADGLKTTASWGQGTAVDHVAEVTLVVGKDVLRWLAPVRDHVCAIIEAVVFIPAYLWIRSEHFPRAIAGYDVALSNGWRTIVDVDVHNELPVDIALGVEVCQAGVKAMADTIDLLTGSIGCGRSGGVDGDVDSDPTNRV